MTYIEFKVMYQNRLDGILKQNLKALTVTNKNVLHFMLQIK